MEDVCGWVCISEISHFKNGENAEVYEKMFKIHTTEDGKGILKTIWSITAGGYINQNINNDVTSKIWGLWVVLTFFFIIVFYDFYKITGI